MGNKAGSTLPAPQPSLMGKAHPTYPGVLNPTTQDLTGFSDSQPFSIHKQQQNSIIFE
jgi:hypothetical protein